MPLLSFFFFNDTATTEIYTLSLHDALPISRSPRLSNFQMPVHRGNEGAPGCSFVTSMQDRKSTRLNSSHLVISYAVFCLKKKKTHNHAENIREQIDHGRVYILLAARTLCDR